MAAEVEVQVEGVSGTIRDTVLANLSLERERDHPLLDSFRIERLHQRAPDEIRNALRPFGYYTPLIQSQLRREEARWIARYVVDPGQPVRVAQVAITIEGPGADDPVLAEWRRNFPLAAGDILLDQVYEEAKDNLLRTGRERGYLYGFLAEHQIDVRADEGTADIRLRYVTGKRMRFGAVTFTRDDLPLRESLLRKYPAFTEGEPYDAEKLYQLHRDLTNSDYFQKVDVVPETDAPVGDEVPVEVTLEMRKRDRYTAGLGYGTDTGPRATLGYERRWVNDLGHRFSSEAVVSEVRQGVSADYRIPLDRPTTDYLGITASRVREDTTSFVRDTSTVGANVTHQVNAWTRTVSINYQEENYEFGAPDSNTRSTMLYPGLALVRVSADDRFFPTRGWRLRLDGRVAAEDYYSSTSLVQGGLGGKAVVPLWGGRLMPRFDLGASYVSDFEQLPASLRFFAGGDQSVRGYAYQSLGVLDKKGNVIGGEDLLVGSLEYDHYLDQKWGLALFHDSGNAFNSFGDYDLKQGAGAGVRYRLPFGVVRLDCAWALSKPGTPWRIHFTIGPDL
jgi:translocation and assembly module TamA